MAGEILPLAKAATESGFVPTRPLGGWMCTYAQIGANGGLVPTQDREGHTFEAAGALGRIDFSSYLAKGKWNDTHRRRGGLPDAPKIVVGLPTGLEFHDETTELAKAHRKVGWWTEGHLFDRADPRSWTLFGDYEPTAEDLQRADHFWTVATMLKGLPRPLGFSAEGKMLVSPCGKRIIWAQVTDNAVCEVPQNPDAVAVPLRLAVPITHSMVGASPCDSCRCPPGARCPTLRPAPSVAGGVEERRAAAPDLAELVAQRNGVSIETARRWVRQYQSRGAAPRSIG